MIVAVATTMQRLCEKIDGRLVLYAYVILFSCAFSLFYFDASTSLTRYTPKDAAIVHDAGYALGFILTLIISLGTIVWAFIPLAFRDPVILKELPAHFRIIGTLLSKQDTLDLNLIGVSGAFWSVAGLIGYFLLGAPTSSAGPFDQIVNHIGSQCSFLVYLFFALPILLSAVAWLSQRSLALSATTVLEDGWDDLADLRQRTVEEVSRIESKMRHRSMRKTIVSSLSLRERRYIAMVQQLKKLLAR